MKTTYKNIETNLIHAGEPDPLIEGAVSMPVFQSSTFEYAGKGSYHDLKYIRLNNTPNHMALHQKLAAIEGGQAAVVMSSGMAAITTALLTFLKTGDHILGQDCLYGGTLDLLTTEFADLGISYSTMDGTKPEVWEKALRPETRVLYMESITNPLLQVACFEEAVKFAREHGLVSIIDNTFASPVNFRPIEWGFDLSLHSCTKYLNGHSDIVAGAVIGNSEHIEKITRRLNHYGGSLDPHACYLLHRGLKTLAVRVAHQNKSALAVSKFLEAQPAVKKVHYPGLDSNEGHDRAGRYFSGFGGMMSFELHGDVADAERFIQNTKIPICAPSLGGVETLITRPATTSHSGVPPEELENMGISQGLIRLSTGLEHPDDLMEDFESALRQL